MKAPIERRLKVGKLMSRVRADYDGCFEALGVTVKPGQDAWWIILEARVDLQTLRTTVRVLESEIDKPGYLERQHETAVQLLKEELDAYLRLLGECGPPQQLHVLRPPHRHPHQDRQKKGHPD